MGRSELRGALTGFHTAKARLVITVVPDADKSVKLHQLSHTHKLVVRHRSVLCFP